MKQVIINYCDSVGVSRLANRSAYKTSSLSLCSGIRSSQRAGRTTVRLGTACSLPTSFFCLRPVLCRRPPLAPSLSPDVTITVWVARIHCTAFMESYGGRPSTLFLLHRRPGIYWSRITGKQSGWSRVPSWATLLVTYNHGMDNFETSTSNNGRNIIKIWDFRVEYRHFDVWLSAQYWNYLVNCRKS